MDRSARTRERIPRLTPIAASTLIAISLVSAPPATAAISHHAAVAPAQTIAVELTSTARRVDTAFTTPVPSATASGPTVDNLAKVALLIALTPVWYAAFPVTLPATLVLTYFVAVAVSCIGGCGKDIDPAGTLALGLGAWALGPIDRIQDAVKKLVPKPVSTKNAQQTTSAARPAATGVTPAQGRPTTHGVAHSRRTAGEKPAAQQTIAKQSKASAATKHTGTAGSARGLYKGVSRG
ncbi:hypothetical protein [Mycobacterium sp. shizuoka-1]|uniref:hypothetical protein n=1 Tax=Mycobacterium sp. shizuoka-1 TaxID=2039281 RepID=UPI000C067ACE|nr:hypothetical protein [Mycobacterium sp. shizuoka-1]GAY16479.1 hypothetical protein MSZK_32050 [Mycobacterium sp. shizuoka-1]